MFGRTLALVILVGAGLHACGASADTLSDAREKGTIRVGVGLMGTKPFVWQDSNGDYVGIEADLTKELVKRLGIKNFDYVVTEWSTLIPGLKANRWDLLVTGLVKTEERVQGGGILMSTPYLMAYDKIIVTKDSPIKSEADLNGKVLATLLGSTDSLVAHSIVDRGGAADVKDFNTYAEPFMALRNKQADAVVFDQFTFHGFQESMPDLMAVGDPILYVPKREWADAQAKADYKLGGAAIAVRHEDTALLDAINKALDDMDADGTRQKILEKYNSWDDLQTRKAMMK
jgi:ABC-type amino acid transport substrate-binding protein